MEPITFWNRLTTVLSIVRHYDSISFDIFNVCISFIYILSENSERTNLKHTHTHTQKKWSNKDSYVNTHTDFWVFRPDYSCHVFAKVSLRPKILLFLVSRKKSCIGSDSFVQSVFLRRNIIICWFHITFPNNLLVFSSNFLIYHIRQQFLLSCCIDTFNAIDFYCVSFDLGK